MAACTDRVVCLQSFTAAAYHLHSQCGVRQAREADTCVRVAHMALSATVGWHRHPIAHIHHRGASIKTRKRNIAVPLDPGSFANALVQIFEDSGEANASVEKNLEAAGKILDSAELDFKRYGDTFFEVLYAGGRMLGGGNLAEGPKLDTNVCWWWGRGGCWLTTPWCVCVCIL